MADYFLPPELKLEKPNMTQSGSPTFADFYPGGGGSYGRSWSDSHDSEYRGTQQEVYRPGVSPEQVAYEQQQEMTNAFARAITTGEPNSENVTMKLASSRVVMVEGSKDDQLINVGGITAKSDPQSIQQVMKLLSNQSPVLPEAVSSNALHQFEDRSAMDPRIEAALQREVAQQGLGALPARRRAVEYTTVTPTGAALPRRLFLRRPSQGMGMTYQSPDETGYMHPSKHHEVEVVDEYGMTPSTRRAFINATGFAGIGELSRNASVTETGSAINTSTTQIKRTAAAQTTQNGAAALNQIAIMFTQIFNNTKAAVTKWNKGLAIINKGRGVYTQNVANQAMFISKQFVNLLKNMGSLDKGRTAAYKGLADQLTAAWFPLSLKTPLVFMGKLNTFPKEITDIIKAVQQAIAGYSALVKEIARLQKVASEKPVKVTEPTPQEKCAAAGGKWNATTKSCSAQYAQGDKGSSASNAAAQLERLKTECIKSGVGVWDAVKGTCVRVAGKTGKDTPDIWAQAKKQCAAKRGQWREASHTCVATASFEDVNKTQPGNLTDQPGTEIIVPGSDGTVPSPTGDVEQYGGEAGAPPDMGAGTGVTPEALAKRPMWKTVAAFGLAALGVAGAYMIVRD